MHADQEDLIVLGPRSPRRGRAMLGVAAVALVAVSVLGGWRWGRSSEPAAPVPASRAIELVAGPFEANLEATEGPEFVIPIYNVGDRAVRVTNVAPGMWRATSSPVTLAPGASAEVPVDVSIDCRQTPSPTGEVVVHATSSGRSAVQTLHLPSVPRVLTEEYERLCVVPAGRVPGRQELVGVWIVDEGNFFAGQMLIDLEANGTWAMDPGTNLFSEPGAYGVFTYRPGGLTLFTRGGRDCRRGDRSLWRVGLMSDGRLRMKVVTFADSLCTLEDGEVWIARRVSEPAR
jgi:hypothetical protein